MLCHAQGVFKSTALHELLDVLRLAQYLLAGACRDAAAAAVLAAARPEAAALSFGEALRALASPGLVCMEPQLQPVVDKCCAALVQRLKGTLEVARDAELHELWLSLPAAAVEALLSPLPDVPGLRVDCEDTVLLLLHRWAERNALALPPPAAAAAGGPHLWRLRGLLRPLQPSPAYLLHVLPQLKWVGLTPAEAADLSFAVVALAGASGSPLGVFAWSMSPTLPQRRACAGLPTFAAGQQPQWLQLRCEASSTSSNAAPRLRQPPCLQVAPPTHFALCLRWDLPWADLLEALERGKSRASADAAVTAAPGPGTVLASCCMPTGGACCKSLMAGFNWGLQLQVTAASGWPRLPARGRAPHTRSCTRVGCT